MKRLIAVLLLAALLIGTLAACSLIDDLFGGGNADVEDYHALMQELSALTEYMFTGDVTLELGNQFDVTVDLFDEFNPMNFSITGTVSHLHREMVASYQHRAAGGVRMFDMDTLLTDDFMYIGLVSLMEYTLAPTLASIGIDIADFSVRAMLGGYEYLMVPYEGTLTDMMFAPTELTAGLDIEPFLTRVGDTFTITLTGEDVRTISDEMGAMLEQFAHGDGMGNAPMGSALDDVSSRLAIADLTGARVQVVTAREREGAFSQNIEMRVPGLIDMQASFSFVPQWITPVGAPRNAIIEDELEELLRNLDFNVILSGDTELPTDGEVVVVTDLGILSLVNPFLLDDSHLELIALPVDVTFTVAVVADSDLTIAAGDLIVDADAIEMRYTVATSTDAPEAVMMSFAADRAEYFLSDSRFNMSHLRTNEDRNVAALAVAEQTAAGITRISVYLASNLAALDGVLRLDMRLYLDIFTDVDYAILDELGMLFGMDLTDFVMGLV